VIRTNVSNVPIAEVRTALFSVSFGETRRSELIDQRPRSARFRHCMPVRGTHLRHRHLISDYHLGWYPLLLQRQQSADCGVVVQIIAWNDPRRCVDGLAGLLITAPQCFDSPAGKPGVIVNDPAIEPRETNAAIGDLLKTESAFVHETMVTAAQ